MYTLVFTNGFEDSKIYISKYKTKKQAQEAMYKGIWILLNQKEYDSNATSSEELQNYINQLQENPNFNQQISSDTAFIHFKDKEFLWTISENIPDIEKFFKNKSEKDIQKILEKNPKFFDPYSAEEVLYAYTNFVKKNTVLVN